MPTNVHESVRQKVKAIFTELSGERVQRLNGGTAESPAQSPIVAALRDDLSEEVARDVAFHLTDWNSDAAFLVALLLFPERFAKEEVYAGIQNFLVHAPNHVAAAAKLAGWPIKDVFKVGAVSRAEE